MEHKTLNLANCEIKMTDSGTFSGYASTFGNIDSYGDTILRGAYKQTLAEHGMPKMFVLHRSNELPIGKWLDAGEDSKGLFVKGELTPNMSVANDVHAAMKHETLDGLSIGYMLRKGDYSASDKAEGGRIIKNVTILSEISPVTFPADSFAKIDMASVKSQLETIETIKEFEHYLRDVGNFSREHAKMLCSQAKVLFGQRDAGSEIDVKSIQALQARLDKFAIPN